MAYDKHTYAKGDVLEASDLNHGETGIDTNDENITTLRGAVGTLTNLTTDAKTSLVAAINEVDSHADSANSNAGTLSSLTTDTKNNLVAAINEVDSHADAAATAIGDMTDLETTATDLVGAANELKDKLDTLPDPAQDDGTFVITQHNGNMELTEMDTALGDSEVIQNKADIDGTYPDMVAGNMLSNTGLTDMVPYNFRASAGGPREYDEIVGGTVAWNQLIQNGNFVNTDHWSTPSGGVTFSVSNNTLSVTRTSDSSTNPYVVQQLSKIPANHVVMLSIDIKVSTVIANFYTMACYLGDYGSSQIAYIPSDTNWHKLQKMSKAVNGDAFEWRFGSGSTEQTAQVKNAMLIDLTATFGTTIADYIYALEQATAGAGVTWLKSHGFMTKDYYAYNAGSLESVQTSGHVMTGKNWLDPQAIVQGSIVTPSSPTRCGTRGYKNILVKPGDVITVIRNSSDIRYSPGILSMNDETLYDPGWQLSDSCTYTSSVLGYLYVGFSYSNDAVITPTDVVNAGFMVMINAVNNTYEPYRTWNYPLDSSLTLRGIMKLQDGKPYFDGDRYLPSGQVERRYARALLSKFNWEYNTEYHVGYTYVPNKKWGRTNMISSKFTTVNKFYDELVNGEMSGGELTSALNIRIDSTNSLQDFLSSIAGQYIVFELDATTTETATPFTSPQTVDPYGTEAYTDAAYAAGDRDFELPVGHETFYPTDQAKKLDSLPFLIDNAGSHNAIYRGKYLGNTVTAEQYAAISDGSFKDLYIGDYWTINGVNWRIAHCDYWLRYGDTECTTHHLVIVPDTNLLAGNGSTTHWMNATDTTTGAYVGSDWYTGNNDNTGRSQVTTMINNAFGSAHILTHREYLKNATANGYESAGAWYDSTHEFMTEEMVYGTKEFKNIVNGTNIPAGYTIDHGQLALFRHDHSRICNRAAWWLRDVVSSAHFAYVNTTGHCNNAGASYPWVGVRVDFGIKA